MTDAIANIVDRSAQTSQGTAVASIMVYVDFDPGSDSRIKIAAEWAAKFGRFSSALQAGCRDAKSESGSPPSWHGPKTGLTE